MIEVKVTYFNESEEPFDSETFEFEEDDSTDALDDAMQRCDIPEGTVKVVLECL